jgi:hypothetical protein
MIKNQPITAYDIERIALSVSDDLQPGDDTLELIGLYLENIAGWNFWGQSKVPEQAPFTSSFNDSLFL